MGVHVDDCGEDDSGQACACAEEGIRQVRTCIEDKGGVAGKATLRLYKRFDSNL